jgi:hypothetical protein
MSSLGSNPSKAAKFLYTIFVAIVFYFASNCAGAWNATEIALPSSDCCRTECRREVPESRQSREIEMALANTMGLWKYGVMA